VPGCSIPDSRPPCVLQKTHLVPKEYLNSKKELWNPSVPGMSFCEISQQPTIGLTGEQLAQIVRAVNSRTMPRECVIPTPDTKIQYTADGKSVKRVMVQINSTTVARKQETRPNALQRLFPSQDHDDEENDVKQYGEAPFLKMFIRFFPVYYQGEDEEDQIALLRVITLLSPPGVHPVKCIENVCDPQKSSGWKDDSRFIEESKKMTLNWERIIGNEMEALGYGDMARLDEGFLSFKNPSTVKQYPLHICSEWNIVRKVYFLAHKMGMVKDAEIRDLQIIGLPMVLSSNLEDVVEQYNEAILYEQERIIKWCQAFDECVSFLFVHNNKKRKTPEEEGEEDSIIPDVVEFHLPILPFPQILPNFTSNSEKYFGRFESPFVLALHNLRCTDEEETLALPQLVRIRLLDYLHNTNDREISIRLLSDHDKKPFSLSAFIRKISGNHLLVSDSLVRQDTHCEWKVGFEKYMGELIHKATEENQPKFVSAPELLSRHMCQLRKTLHLHLANMDEDHYGGTIILDAFKIFTELKSVLVQEIQDNFKEYFLDREVRDHEEGSFRKFDSLTQMRLLFYNVLRHFNNSYSHLTYANLNLLVEIYTSRMQFFFTKKKNSTWENFGIGIHIAPAKAGFYHTLKGKEKAIVVAKPNSSGADFVVDITKLIDNLVDNIESHREGKFCNVSMNRVPRQTAFAIEKKGKATISNGRIIDMPDPETRYRGEVQVEMRTLQTDVLTTHVRETPRNPMERGDGISQTTEIPDNGKQRRLTVMVPVPGNHNILFATNVFLQDERQAEQYHTWLLVLKTMSTAGQGEANPRFVKHHSDRVVGRSSGRSMKPKENDRKKMRGILTVLPLLTGVLLGLQNQMGFTCVEMGFAARQLIDYLMEKFQFLFLPWVGQRHETSIARTFMMHTGRHIADYACARLALECTSPDATLESAVTSAAYGLEFCALPLHAVPGYIDDVITELQDQQVLYVMSLLCDLFNVPVLDLPWLFKLLSCGVHGLDAAERELTNPNVNKFVTWVHRLHNEGVFVPYNEESPVDRRAYLTRKESVPCPFTVVASSFSEMVTKIAEGLQKLSSVKHYTDATKFRVSDKMLENCLVRLLSCTNMNLHNIFRCADITAPQKIFQICKSFSPQLPLPHAEFPNARTFSSEMAAFAEKKDGDVTKYSFMLHSLSALCYRAMLGRKFEMNSNMDSRLSESFMWFLLADVPRQFLGSDGATYLAKHFYGDDTEEDIRTEAPREHHPYITRVDHDVNKLKGNDSRFFPKNPYHSYVIEDLAHMEELIGMANKYACNVQDLCFTHESGKPLIVPRYAFLHRVPYPIVLCGDRNSDDWLTGSLILDSPTSCSLSLTDGEEAGGYMETLNATDLEYELARRNLCVLPLIMRPNAVIRRPGSDILGVLLPCNEDCTHFFDKTSGKYHAAFSDGSELYLHPFDVESSLVTLSDKIYLRMDLYDVLLSEAIQRARALFEQTRHPLDESDDVAAKFSSHSNLPRPTTFVEAVVWYPRTATNQDKDLRSIFIQMPYRVSSQKSGVRFYLFQVQLETIETLHSTPDDATPSFPVITTKHPHTFAPETAGILALDRGQVLKQREDGGGFRWV